MDKPQRRVRRAARSKELTTRILVDRSLHDRRNPAFGHTSTVWEEAMVAIYPDLAGKVVLVTGGASGVGEAIVRGFARQRSTVV